MTTIPTPEAFLAEPTTDEDDLETDEQHAVDPLTAIAASLQELVYIASGQAQAGTEEDELRGEVLGLRAEVERIEALHDAKQSLIEQVLAVCKPSVSKLANQVREVLEPVVVPPSPEPDGVPTSGRIVDPAVQCPGCERYFSDQELLDQHACTAAQPAYDADVEVWREYARTHELASDVDVDRLNRSQIRTLLGIPQTSAE